MIIINSYLTEWEEIKLNLLMQLPKLYLINKIEYKIIKKRSHSNFIKLKTILVLIY